jgi:hypothetical protein
METKKPTHRIKRGTLEATIWTNASKNGSFDRATIARTYRDAAGKLATSASFGSKELGDVALLAIEAQRWIREAEAARHTAGEGASDETEPDAEMPE